MKNSILNGFKNTKSLPFQEVLKGIYDASNIDNKKFDIFSKSQVKCFLNSVIKDNQGLSKELQKGIVESTRAEFKKLIPITLKKNGKPAQFFISNKGECTELLKAFEPVNENEDYFDDEEEFDEEEVLDFIKNNEADDDALINEFGDGIIDYLHKLIEDGKIDVDEKKEIYIVKDSFEKGGEEGNKEEKEEEEEDKIESEGMGLKGEEIKEEGDDLKKEGDDLEEKEEKEGDDLEEKEDDDLEEKEEKEGDDLEEKEGDDLEEKEEKEDDDLEEKEEKEGDDLEEKEEKEGDDLEEKEDDLKEKEEYSTEELEAMAKKTATATLVKFYKNSNDEDKKEVVKLELKTRGIDVDSLGGEEGEEKSNLPETKQDLDKLNNWIHQLFNDYDSEDLREYVSGLVLQSPLKTKELKNHYREFYKMSNGGNSLTKVDNKEFKEWLSDNYFKSFADTDLQEYAFNLISKNPIEYTKLKKDYKAFEDNNML